MIVYVWACQGSLFRVCVSGVCITKLCAWVFSMHFAVIGVFKEHKHFYLFPGASICIAGEVSMMPNRVLGVCLSDVFPSDVSEWCFPENVCNFLRDFFPSSEIVSQALIWVGENNSNIYIYRITENTVTFKCLVAVTHIIYYPPPTCQELVIGIWPQDVVAECTPMHCISYMLWRHQIHLHNSKEFMMSLVAAGRPQATFILMYIS